MIDAEAFGAVVQDLRRRADRAKCGPAGERLLAELALACPRGQVAAAVARTEVALGLLPADGLAARVTELQGLLFATPITEKGATHV